MQNLFFCFSFLKYEVFVSCCLVLDSVTEEVKPDRQSPLSPHPSLLTACPVPFQFCQAKQKAALLELLHELYNFLAIQAGEWVS